MLFIDKNAPNIIHAHNVHVKKTGCRIRRRIGGQKCSDVNCEVCRVNCRTISGVPIKLREILADEQVLSMILGSEPDELYLLSTIVWQEIIPNFSAIDYEQFFKARSYKPNKRTVDDWLLVRKYEASYDLLTQIFDYEGWFQNTNNAEHYDAYCLAVNLDRNTCTYCNRLYTSTMKTRKNKKVMRPTFDHWFSKSKHPLLALSFYNLIPSCSICNTSIKGTKEYLLNTHLHPYVDIDCLEQFQYGYYYLKSTRQFDVYLSLKPNAPKAFRTCYDLKLREMYNAHHSELADLIRIKTAYSEKYIENMLKTYSAAGLSHREVYRLAFGTELEENDFYKRPLSKFKKDILAKLELLGFLQNSFT